MNIIESCSTKSTYFSCALVSEVIEIDDFSIEERQACGFQPQRCSIVYHPTPGKQECTHQVDGAQQNHQYKSIPKCLLRHLNVLQYATHQKSLKKVAVNTRMKQFAISSV